MFARQYRRYLFPDLRLEGYGLVRGIGPSRRRIYNIRAAWAEAEVFVIRQLRMGTHPNVLERDIDAELLVTNRAGYRYDCLRYARRILMNLRNAGQFDGLPTFGQFEQIKLLRPRRANYEMMMYDRFRNFDLVIRHGGDIDIAREIARARALDREAEEELRRMREADCSQLEEQYRANEAVLRAEVQEAMFRAETAEARLQFEQQQRPVARMPFAGYAPLPYQYAPFGTVPAAPPIPQPYYAAPMNTGNQRDRYQDNQVPYAAREGFQPQRPYPPNQCQQQQNDYQRQNGRDPRHQRAESEYASTIYSDDSYYRRGR